MYTILFGFPGPWLVGELLTGHMGIIFLWGTFVKGTFMPGSLSYIYGISQVLKVNLKCIFNLPFLKTFAICNKMQIMLIKYVFYIKC